MMSSFVHKHPHIRSNVIYTQDPANIFQITSLTEPDDDPIYRRQISLEVKKHDRLLAQIFQLSPDQTSPSAESIVEAIHGKLLHWYLDSATFGIKTRYLNLGNIHSKEFARIDIAEFSQLTLEFRVPASLKQPSERHIIKLKRDKIDVKTHIISFLDGQLKFSTEFYDNTAPYEDHGYPYSITTHT